MTEKVKEILYGVAEDIFEKLAFIFSFREEERGDMDYADAMAAGVSFSGQFEGRLVMVVSTDMLPELAGNMLGLDDVEDTTPEQQQDALKELINVVCGNLLPEIAGKEIVFNVDAPRIIPDPSAVGRSATPVAVARLALEEGQCDILFFIDGEIPAALAAD
jgi:CheY-specific phosphatase CheX